MMTRLQLALTVAFVGFLLASHAYEEGKATGYRRAVKEVLEAQSAADMDGLCAIIEDYKADGFPPTETE